MADTGAPGLLDPEDEKEEKPAADSSAAEDKGPGGQT